MEFLIYDLKKPNYESEQIFLKALPKEHYHLLTMIVCLDYDINVSVAENMMKMYKGQSLEIRKVVCKDNGFADNYTKTNIKLTLVQLMIEKELFTTV